MRQRQKDRDEVDGKKLGVDSKDEVKHILMNNHLLED